MVSWLEAELERQDNTDNGRWFMSKFPVPNC